MNSEPTPVFLPSNSSLSPSQEKPIAFHRFSATLRKSKDFQGVVRGMQNLFVKRVLKRLRQDGTLSRADLREIEKRLNEVQMEIFTVNPNRALRALRSREELYLAIPPSKGAFNGQDVVDILPSQIRGHLVFPRGEDGRAYLPTASEQLSPALPQQQVDQSPEQAGAGVQRTSRENCTDWQRHESRMLRWSRRRPVKEVVADSERVEQPHRQRFEIWDSTSEGPRGSFVVVVAL